MKIGCQKLGESCTMKCQECRLGWCDETHKSQLPPLAQAAFKQPMKINSIYDYIQWPDSVSDNVQFWKTTRDALRDERLRRVWMWKEKRLQSEAEITFYKAGAPRGEERIIWLCFARCPVIQAVTALTMFHLVGKKQFDCVCGLGWHRATVAAGMSAMCTVVINLT